MKTVLDKEGYKKLHLNDIVLIDDEFMNMLAKHLLLHDEHELCKSTITNALSKATSSQKEIIKEVFEIKDELEEGCWYWICRDGWGTSLIYNNGKDGSYGWNYSDEYTTCFGLGNSIKWKRTFTKATDEEVLERFKKEFAERGFVEGCKFEGWDKEIFTYNSNISLHSFNNRIIIGGSGGMLFEKGAFSKPIPKKEKNTITQEELPKEMYVWDNVAHEDILKRTVVFIDNGKYISRRGVCGYHTSWDNCKEIN